MINGEYRIDEPKKGIRKIFALIIFLILILLGVGIIYYFTKINRGASQDSIPVAITINNGSSTKKIAAELAEKNIIRNPNLFLVYTILNNASGKIQAGDYVLDRKMSIVEIVDVLTAGKVTRNDKKITIIEGWSNSQIGKYLEQRNISTQKEFDTALAQSYDFKFADVGENFSYQGFLFPDTYEIAKSAGPENLVKQALKNFESKFTQQMQNDFQSKNLKLADVIILASIIEKEVGRNTTNTLTKSDLENLQRERELVASVFFNRLEIDMALQSDATVNYITGKNDRSAKAEDLAVDSPYNTYKYPGLPPGPISNPGLGAIKAAINPAQSDYLYFLNKPDGEAVFSKTLEEHNTNKAKYLR